MEHTVLKKHSCVLELPKILERLSLYCHCSDTVEAAKKLQPQTQLADAQRLLDQTIEAYELTARYGAPSFGGLSNVNGCLTRASAGGTLSMAELLRVGETLRLIRSLKQWQENHASNGVALQPYFEVLQPNTYLENKIFTAIISEEEMSDQASPALADIRRKIRSASGKIREQLDRFIHNKNTQKYLQDPIVTIRGGRFVVPVKAEHRGDVSGLVHDTSSSGSTLFIEPTVVVEANNEIKVLESKEREEIERILAKLSAEAGSFGEGISLGFVACCELDLIFAKAKMGFDMKASQPLLNDKGFISIKKGRHPLLDPQKVVPIDIRLGDEFDTLVITGPNTGGKTVSLKTLGLLTLMAMCGFMIPAGDESHLSVFENVFADIGDEQSIEQALSTFSAHMTKMIEILKAVNDRSLVLADELGSGTDPVEGAALATAILETLRLRGVRIAATTHYAELKAFALQTVGVENACCEFDVATLRPTYRLLIGMPGRSNAFAILHRLGMEESIIDRSRKLVSDESRKFEQVVEKLERSHTDLEAERAEIAQLKKQARELSQQAAAERLALQKEREKILQEAKRLSADIVAKTRAQAQQTMDQLEQLKRETNSQNAAQMIRRAKAEMNGSMRRLEDSADPVDQVSGPVYRLPRPLKAGDNVLIADIDKKGVVLTPTDASGYVYVQAGIVKTKVAEGNLRLLENEKPQIPKVEKRTIGIESRGLRKVSTELDLRGKAADEGLVEVDQFIDQAVLTGIETVTIIHGKGTGVLRQAVRQHLKTHRSVASFRRGQYGEGEDGVTVVTLK
ncbi:MAG: endonuclease MutS2 [Clostridia bacterium]|nr:endonuclease MutS2 [Clostridia bacterium]